MTAYKSLFLALIIIGFTACEPPVNYQEEAQQYLDTYNKKYQELYYASSKAEWKSNTEIIEGDSTNGIATRRANEAMATFTGGAANIEMAQKYLAQQDKLTALQVKQLNSILYKAANNPETVSEIVKARIKAETEQTEKLYGYEFTIDGEAVTPNEIDNILSEENDLAIRLSAWRASKEVGKTLKDGLEHLRNLRNQTVQALGYDDYFNYQVSDYGMTTKELSDQMKNAVKEVWPLYRELHTYARYAYAKKYGAEEVPEMLPAHWLPNRWGQDWGSLVSVEGLDLDSIIGTKSPEWVVKQGERFYISIGLPELPSVFWEKSDLYPLPEGADYKKNNHASAWHLDLNNDVRSLMSVEANPSWYETSHHELGHIYYFLLYSNPDVPAILREGANRGYHEALGSLMGLAAMQEPFLDNLGLMPEGVETDKMQVLLKDAMNYIVFIPWSAGVMTHFEHDLYATDLPKSEYNKRWWELKKMYQGIVPPENRGEEYCDAASKTHINNDAAQYYDYALSYLLLFQFHDHISNNILKQDPHATNYYGNKEIGAFLHTLMYPGATADWRKMLKETTGSELSAKAMLDYFEPLMDFLKEANAGREYTLPDLQ